MQNNQFRHIWIQAPPVNNLLITSKIEVGVSIDGDLGCSQQQYSM
jgi:hypothetical protein